jgi:hypothetical protein
LDFLDLDFDFEGFDLDDFDFVFEDFDLDDLDLLLLPPRFLPQNKESSASTAMSSAPRKILALLLLKHRIHERHVSARTVMPLMLFCLLFRV